MDPQTIIILSLASMLAALAIIVWLVAAQRRREVRKAQVVASLLRKQTEAWKRLSGSAAGAP